ncbi:hypothetical protein LAZ67_2003564 [Cordylochernes scorpioides]|uniref:Uncharacterized protein n=1 Tax=Cordylochernes scorpioides TaxID=51811 RepID=A0ABY6K371_9ARAC|nr:hypothetical protein LAZ67_2003564 [Cordylochernes scorpioides]
MASVKFQYFCQEPFLSKISLSPAISDRKRYYSNKKVSTLFAHKILKTLYIFSRFVANASVALGLETCQFFKIHAPQQREQRLFKVKPFCPCFDFVSHLNGGSTNLHQFLCEKRIQGCRNFLDVANSLRECRHEPMTSFRVVQALQGGSGRDRRQRAFRETVHINPA